MSTQARTRDLQTGTAVRVVYHTPTQTYHLTGVVEDDPADTTGVLVALGDDPHSPVTTARVYATYDAWLEARRGGGSSAPLPRGYVRDRLDAGLRRDHRPQAV